MRNIKFRAWDKQEAKMWPVWGLTPETVCIDNGVDTRWPNICYRSRKHYEVMQSTGCNDKNGIEIFEGDILLVRDSSTPPHGVFREVRWLGLGWTLQLAIDEKVVVGNIYENPELLKEDR